MIWSNGSAPKRLQRRWPGIKPTIRGKKDRLIFSNVVLENKPIVLNVFHSVSREQLERYLYAVTYELLIQVIEEQSVNMSVRQDDKERIAHFYKYAFVCVMLDWVRHDMRVDPQKTVENINLIMHENILNALERYRDDNI